MTTWSTTSPQPVLCMTVINTSPSIHLHLALPGGIEVLPGLVGDVVVPWEVGQELAAGQQKDDTWLRVQSAPGLINRPAPARIHPLLRAQLDAGEAAVIQTALDEGIGSVILDERKARRIAAAMGLSVTGTLGILVQAKLAGGLPSVRDAIASLQQHGIWLEPSLVQKALALAGESP